MELTDILIDLSNSKAALEVANHTIRRMKGKCIRKNILIAGLLWFGFVSCKMVNEAEKQRKEAVASVIQELIEKIDAYGITAKDLGLSIIGKADKAKRGRKPLSAQIAKSGKTGKTYTGPDGQTWTEGTRGRKPAWLTQQLAEGDASDNAEGA